jgi:hypothetical protein
MLRTLVLRCRRMGPSPASVLSPPGGVYAAEPMRTIDTHRLSRQASKYREDLRTSSTIVLDTPISASNRSSNSRSSLYWRRRSNHSAIPANCANGNFQNHPRSKKADKAVLDVSDEPRVLLLQDMFHLLNGAKQRLARELVGRLSKARATPLSYPSSAHKLKPRSVLGPPADH